MRPCHRKIDPHGVGRIKEGAKKSFVFFFVFIFLSFISLRLGFLLNFYFFPVSRGSWDNICILPTFLGMQMTNNYDLIPAGY